MPADLVVLTRADADNQELLQLLRADGRQGLSYPCIEVETVTPDTATLEALRAGGPVHAVAFSSRRAVQGLVAAEALLEALALGPAAAVVGAVGVATARVAKAHGWPAALVPEKSSAATLATLLGMTLPTGARVLIPGGDRPRPELPDGLRERGLEPLPVQVYAHRPVTLAPLSERPAAVVCASPSAAETFLGGNPTLRDVCFVAIGPTTESALRELGAQDVHRAGAPTPVALAHAVGVALSGRE